MTRNKLLSIVNLQLIHKKLYTRDAVRVRFAPSPTGQLHLGGLRTALYNYLFARKNNGSFILRIEDTDQTRLQIGAQEKLHENLIWTGIIPDEDPIRGGPKGPYLQSERLDLYKEQVKVLLDNGSAYYCFCSDRRLELLKKEALKTRQIPKYDNRCRHLEKNEIKQKMEQEIPYCIRFKLSSNPVSFKDIVYRDVSLTLQEGDPVIIKTDGFPTYHFANVVDDHFMEISHVLRGVEWLLSTPKHLELYNAFGWTPPHYAHLPLILNTDGSKLSKRQGDISVESFKKNGIFPLALINYITLAGSGFQRDTNVLTCYNYEELIKQFDITTVNENSSKLNPDLLLDLNRLELCKLLADKVNSKYLVEKVRKLVTEAFPERIKDGSLQLDEDHILTVLNWARNRIHNLNDLVTPNFAFIWILAQDKSVASDSNELESLKMLSNKLMEMNPTDFNQNTLKDYLKDFTKSNGIKFSNFMKLLRKSLSGLEQGPSVAEMMEILGKKETLTRLNKNVDTL
ncbi:probable glutamate--tRNA ligase, mitochondrial [Chelonus insularis]|uniref:probable glutamate--tRNA ligase, mitochondrial n=1 Tax=Chelonus insularis TaxID=460826 RepID=UPI00158B2D05|nr:probable glutamate--tRNA ligase, mitochondrial [Chelonus insularis]